MAVFSNLAGAGTISLTAGVSRLYVDVVVFGNGTSSGMAAPTDYFKLGALRLGVQGLYYGVRYIDGAHIVLDCPEGVTTLGYSCFTSTVITVTEVFNPVPNWQKMPWDRNPRAINGSNQYVFNAFDNLPQTTVYTVPTDRLFLLAWDEVTVFHSTYPTTPVTVTVYSYAAGNILLQADLRLAVAGEEVVDRFTGGDFVLTPGQTLTFAGHNYEATGQAIMFGSWAGTEFDA